MDSGSNQYRKNNFRKAGHNSNASGHKISNGSKREIPNQLSQQFDQYGNPIAQHQIHSNQQIDSPQKIPNQPSQGHQQLNNSNLNAYGDNYHSQVNNDGNQMKPNDDNMAQNNNMMDNHSAMNRNQNDN